MKILLDMNLSPDWVQALQQEGWSAQHWSTIGDPRTTDREIMQWAKSNNHIVFTHDLDFGTLLATTRADGPSVIQVRTQDIMPENLGKRIISILREHQTTLEAGALITVDENKSRIRILPFS